MMIQSLTERLKDVSAIKIVDLHCFIVCIDTVY